MLREGIQAGEVFLPPQTRGVGRRATHSSSPTVPTSSTTIASGVRNTTSWTPAGRTLVANARPSTIATTTPPRISTSRHPGVRDAGSGADEGSDERPDD